MMAPPAIPGAALLARQQADLARALGASPDDIAAGQAAFKKVVDAIRADAAPDALQAAVRDLIAAQDHARSAAARAELGERGAFVDKILPVGMSQLGSRWMRD